MSKITDTLRKAASLYDALAEALEAISRLTQTTLDDEAVQALKAIRVLVATAQAGLDGKVSSDEIRRAVDKLQHDLAANDKEALDRLHKKFDVAE